VPVASAGTNMTQTSFTANWGASTGATEYFLDVSNDIGFTSLLAGYSNLNVGNGATYNVSGLIPGTVYYYRLRAHNTSGTSGNSGSIAVLLIPPNPTLSVIGIITQTSVTVSWNPSKGAAGYLLDVSTQANFLTMWAATRSVMLAM